ncbi:SRPBCC domain-containing protein [Sphingomonas psychrotolerans]|uniref:SRPBCC domain-containing protein n=1 Tax=Sphingomonas psychrotolerans TaxID=1327635 RepID=A0ABU3MZ18_9SPHN|nr:SRPBCC domain-containing protein [Sphingomonas psychrotolerans]MDT8757540.1 SRPBCC domain-containing protein [Sphingomonas psychrotolerans]
MNEAALQTRSREIVVDEVFPHAPATIWRALTSVELMGRWLGMVPTGFEPVPGSRFTYRTTPAGEWDGTIECEVLEAVANRRFAYSWKGGHAGNTGYGSALDTIVTFTLEDVAGGTRLRVVHSGFELPRNETAYTNMSGGWTKVVARLGVVAGEQAE